MLADLLVHNTSEVLTCAGPLPRCGADQADAGCIQEGAVAAYRGRIVFVGAACEWPTVGQLAPGATIVDALGGAVVPGFVDPHTHLVFAGDRRDELRERLAGATYAEIAARGGGILRTVDATRAAPEDALVEQGLTRLGEMLRCGTTTCEVKSGYGLTTASELKMLRAIARLDAAHPIDVVATFLGAHEVPPEYIGRTADYVSLVRHEMIPAVAATGLAGWCDVFCEHGVFGPADATAVLKTAQTAGMKLRVHADELAASGGSGVAADLGARSADHLIFVTERDADRLAASGTVATLLPAAALYLKLGRFAPARMLIDHGVAVALATDLNPGGGFSPSMPFVMTVACFAMGLTFEEALVAATANAAYSLDRHHDVGSLEPGKRMDAVVLSGPAIDLIRADASGIRAVVKGGRIVIGDVGHGDR